MFKLTSFSVFSALVFASACVHPVAPETREGGIRFVSGAGAEGDEATPRQLTITSLERPFQRRVELARDAFSTDTSIELPAGLYAVDGASVSNGDEPVMVALSAPQLVVIAAGRVTTVNVHAVEREVVAALER